MDLEFYKLLHFSFTKLLASIDHRVQISSHSFIVRLLEPSNMVILYISRPNTTNLLLDSVVCFLQIGFHPSIVSRSLFHQNSIHLAKVNF